MLDLNKNRELNGLQLSSFARVTKLADVPDLKSGAPQGAYGFDSRPWHDKKSVEEHV